MELVRYRAGEAIRWLQMGADNIRRSASAKGRTLVRQTGTDQKPLTENVRTAANAIYDLGRSAYADAMHSQAQTQEYILEEDRFDIVRGNSIKTIPYDRVKAIKFSGDKATVMLDKGTLSIRPFAHIVSGRVKVPVGWQRNGTEVPFELLIEELAARCRVDLDED